MKPLQRKPRVYYKGTPSRAGSPVPVLGEIVGRQPSRQLTARGPSFEDTKEATSKRALVRSQSLCGLSSGACVVPRQLHNPRTCAMGATPPALKCDSVTASTSLTAAPDSACSVSNCKASSATAPF